MLLRAPSGSEPVTVKGITDVEVTASNPSGLARLTVGGRDPSKDETVNLRIELVAKICPSNPIATNCNEYSPAFKFRTVSVNLPDP